MGASAEVTMTCDECSESITVELATPSIFADRHAPTTIEEATEGEGWSWHGTLLDRLLCEDCAEAEED